MNVVRSAGSEVVDPLGLFTQDATRVPEENLGNVFRCVRFRAIGAKSGPAKRSPLRRAFLLECLMGSINTRWAVYEVKGPSMGILLDMLTPPGINGFESWPGLMAGPRFVPAIT